MIYRSTVLIAMLVKRTAKIARMATEKNPPVALEYYPSPLYLMNWEMVKRSHILNRDFKLRVNLASMSEQLSLGKHKRNQQCRCNEISASRNQNFKLWWVITWRKQPLLIMRHVFYQFKCISQARSAFLLCRFPNKPNRIKNPSQSRLLSTLIPIHQSIILLVGAANMLKRLFSSSSEIQKAFQECRVDKTHEMCHPQLLVDLAERYLATENRQNNHLNINISLANVASKEINININNNTKKTSKREELIRLLIKKIRNENEVVRIKALIVAHSIIKKTHDPQLIELMLDEADKYLVEEQSPSKKEEKEIEVSLQNGRSEFIKKNIISFYCQYLKKYLMSFETVLFVSRTVNAGNTDYPPKADSQHFMQLINNGFVTLNLVNYILCAQYTFNKMGRYYIDHKEILNLFVMYLSDIIIFNDYIKLITTHSVKAIGDSQKELLSHHFLFITQAQKTSDRLYEFFYNRYYYKEVRMLIEMPKFLTIQSDEFKRLVNHVRKQDKELVVLVKRSKYDSTGRSKSCYSKTMKTEQDISSSNLSSTCKNETLDNSMEDVSINHSVKEKSNRKQSSGAVRRGSKTQSKRSFSEYKV